MKKIHFEDVWIAAEKACETSSLSKEKSIEELQKNILLIEENPEYYISQTLLHISNLSRIYKVNTWDALQKSSTDLLVDFYEP